VGQAILPAAAIPGGFFDRRTRFHQSMKYGYARTSTDDQTTALQLAALKRARCSHVYEDKGLSGAASKRPALARRLRTGDTLIVWKLVRLGRSLRNPITMLVDLRARGVKSHSLAEAIDTTTPTGRAMLQMIGVLQIMRSARLCKVTVEIVVYSDDSAPMSAQAAQSLSVSSLKPVYKLLLANIANDLSDLGPSQKPVVMVGYIESNLTSLVTGTIDDFGCCASIPTDFSVQAIAYEALLESMSESGLNFLSFFSRGYWQTDVILPKDTFPNIGRTVRNKPAESIIYQWFQKK
jgi:hypothetical protein